jgi:hypothetical protein
VAVGFLRPDHASGDTWVYSTHDLHAWPEMYFGGVGWVRFEPTPASRTGSVPSYTTQQLQQTGSTSPTDSPSATASSTRAPKAQDTAPTGSNNTSSSSGGGIGVLGWLLLPAVVVILLLVPSGARSLVRRRRWAKASDAPSFVEAGWRELRDSALDLGIAWDDHVTLRTTAASLTRSFTSPPDPQHPAARQPRRGPDAAPDAEDALYRLVGLLERARYSRGFPDDATSAQQVAVDVDTCVAALRAGADRRQLVLARWFPASLLVVARTSGNARTRRNRAMPEPGVDRAV